MRFSHFSHSRGNEEILKLYSSNRYIAHNRHSYIINRYARDVTLFLTKKLSRKRKTKIFYCTIGCERIQTAAAG